MIWFSLVLLLKEPGLDMIITRSEFIRSVAILDPSGSSTAVWVEQRQKGVIL